MTSDNQPNPSNPVTVGNPPVIETPYESLPYAGHIFGILFMLAGLGAFLCLAFGFSTTVDVGEETVTNIGLVAEQLAGLIASATLFLAGLVILVTGILINTINSKS